MVKLQVKEVAERRGIKTAYGLQKAMNVPPGTAARLWRADMSMIGLGTIDALCEALACEPGDLLVREKAAKVSARKAKAGGGGRRGVS
jgi:DNA-binding Xre family transcriptional regulator